MRVKIWLPMIMFCVALLGCSTQQTTSVSMAPTAESKLKEVQTQLPFQVLLPRSLPYKMQLENLLVSKNPNNGKPNQINLQFSSSGHQLDVIELQADGLGHLAGPEKELTVNNLKAYFQKGDTLTSIIWFDGERQISLSVPSNSDLGPEKALLDIAESFK